MQKAGWGLGGLEQIKEVISFNQLKHANELTVMFLFLSFNSGLPLKICQGNENGSTLRYRQLVLVFLPQEGTVGLGITFL